MKLLSHRTGWIFGASAGLCAIGVGAAACSSSSGNGASTNSEAGAGATTCTASSPNSLQILFNPMYSAYISSMSQHTFVVPVAIGTGVSSATVTWSASDPTAVKFAPDPSTGGQLITVQKSGMVTIFASAGGGTLCGSAPLSVTQSTDDAWSAGNARYNNGIAMGNPFGGGGDGGAPMGPPRGGFMMPSADAASPFEPADGGPGPACTNCHGPTATGGIFTGVEHTPEQTAGFSDEDLTNIIVNGIIPDGGYYNSSVVPYFIWQLFHKWRDMTPDQVAGMVTYLRSLTPAPAGGKFDFGGRMPGGGGPPMTTEEAGTVEEGGAESDAAEEAATEAGSSDAGTAKDATTD